MECYWGRHLLLEKYYRAPLKGGFLCASSLVPLLPLQSASGGLYGGVYTTGRGFSFDATSEPPFIASLYFSDVPFANACAGPNEIYRTLLLCSGGGVGVLRVLDAVPRAAPHVRHRHAQQQLDRLHRQRAPRPLPRIG